MRFAEKKTGNELPTFSSFVQLVSLGHAAFMAHSPFATVFTEMVLIDSLVGDYKNGLAGKGSSSSSSSASSSGLSHDSPADKVTHTHTRTRSRVGRAHAVHCRRSPTTTGLTTAHPSGWTRTRRISTPTMTKTTRSTLHFVVVVVPSSSNGLPFTVYRIRD